MSQQDLLRRVIQALDSAAIDYMVTGSVASSLQGEPRATHELDVVVQIDEDAVPDLLASFPTAPWLRLHQSAKAVMATRVRFLSSTHLASP